MHICMVCQDFPPYARGAGYYTYYLSKELVERGHEVTVLTRGGWRGTYREEIDGISVYRVRFVPIYPFHLQLHGFFINRLINDIESDIDLLHVHNPTVPVVNSSLPIILTQHGTIKSSIVHRTPNDLLSIGIKIFSPLLISTEKKLLSSATKVTSVSRSCAQDLEYYYGIKDVEVVYNGVDTNLFIPYTDEDDRKKDVVLYVGSLDALKGLPDLIKSAKYVCEKYSDIEFLIIGEGSLKKKLKKLVHYLGLDNNFRFLGYLNQKKLPEYYRKARIFLNTSYSEGLPTTVLEAMSCEVPVVATAVGGTSEIVINGKNGFLVPPKAPSKLSETIMMLLENRNKGKMVGVDARKYVRKFHDWSVITDKIENLYESVLR